MFLIDVFSSLFLFVFKLLFPLFSNPVLVTFCAILGLFIWLAVFVYKKIKRHTGLKSKGKDFWIFIGLCCLELFLVLYLFWYVFIHFWTYKLIK